MDSLTLNIDKKDYTIQSLTFGQLMELHVGVIRPASQDLVVGTREWWEQTAKIIAAAITDKDQPVTPDQVIAMRFGTLQEAVRIRSEILIFGGFMDRPKEGDKSGEAPAAAA